MQNYLKLSSENSWVTKGSTCHAGLENDSGKIQCTVHVPVGFRSKLASRVVYNVGREETLKIKKK